MPRSYSLSLVRPARFLMQTEKESIKSNKASPYLVSKVSVRKKNWGFRLLEEVMIKSWWVIFSILIGGFVYDRAIQELRTEELRLQSKVSSLCQDILSAQEKQRQLQLHLQHWQDSAAIEAALIQRLGLIPKGYKKLCVSPKQQSENKD
ncbi:hypothetical protein CpB0405 [Chlamydia pneumoniae TW-183]|uniref:Cell division protein FtsL n=3 Tax=Chlamydia pneumoniae TaxID=83558 RepID=A0ABN3YRJ5_CHLPN|nr:hypothetical protein CpB0405 [Chlamydia pneumoniae TW-183]